MILNPRKEQVQAPLDELNAWIEKYSPEANFLLCTYDSKYITHVLKEFKRVGETELFKKSDLVVTLGGDGTILRTVHQMGQNSKPILGVNLGGLGFLAETHPENIVHHVSAYLDDTFFIDQRTLLKCTEKKSGDTFYAFNDIVFDKAGFSRVIEIVTKVDDCLLNSYIADGLILSTPTGSTGYSLSGGGPIVVPQTNVFIINPICPHSLTNRPVVVPDESTISIQVFTEFEKINLFCDGQREKSYSSGTSFIIQKGEYKANLVKMKPQGFYETLRNKLGWGNDFRDKNRWSYQKNNSRH